METRTCPHGSFWMMLAIAAIVVGLNACSGDKKQEQNASAPGAPSAPIGEASISGTISLDPALKDKVGKAPLLMIIASTSSNPSKPALVVKREADASFPYNYKLTAEDITLVGSSFEGKMYVAAGSILPVWWVRRVQVRSRVLTRVTPSRQAQARSIS
ncbi:MAG TPA: hypothetical protein VES66_05325 [Terriglobales bacterium]|nr:hypothetical protein [Terriglobales bacterium]